MKLLIRKDITIVEEEYISSLKVSDITKDKSIDSKKWYLLTYSKPHDICDGIEVHLGNMAGGYPFTALGREWKSVEFLYLCGEWSLEGPEYTAIQEDVCSAKSGYAAKRFKKPKYKKKIREDFQEFRHMWMLWCVWQKVTGNNNFKEHLMSLSDDRIIVEVVKNDPIWASWPDENGILKGKNGMGTILQICKKCIKNNTEPKIDRKMLNNAGIWIFGKKVKF